MTHQRCFTLKDVQEYSYYAASGRAAYKRRRRQLCRRGPGEEPRALRAPQPPRQNAPADQSLGSSQLHVGNVFTLFLFQWKMSNILKVETRIMIPNFNHYQHLTTPGPHAVSSETLAASRPSTSAPHLRTWTDRCSRAHPGRSPKQAGWVQGQQPCGEPGPPNTRKAK